MPVPRLVVRPRRAGSSGRRTSTRTSASSASDYPLHADRRRRRTPASCSSTWPTSREPLLVVAPERASRRITDFDRYRMDELRIGVRLVVRGRGELEDRRRELQRVPPLPDDPPRARPGRPALPLRRGLGRARPATTATWMRDGATSFTRDRGRPTCRRFPDLLPEDYRMYYGTFQFPNLMLNLHPDCGRCTTSLFPRGAEPHDRRLGVPVPARDDRGAGLPARTRSSSSGTSSARQDWAVCERAQTGVALARLQDAASTRARTGSCSTSTSSTAARWADRSSAERAVRTGPHRTARAVRTGTRFPPGTPVKRDVRWFARYP